jgi:hypothetical protein
MLKERGYDLVPVDAPTHFLDDTPTATMIRSILGAVSQFKKAPLVSKLIAAHVRKRKETGKCEGRKSWSELNPGLVRETRRLRRKIPVSGKRKSFARVAKELAESGYYNSKGNQFDPSSIKQIIDAR